MNMIRESKWIGGLSFIVLLCWASLVSAQTFTSGSTGANGAFNPTCAPTPCTVTPPVTLPPSGVFNFTTVDVPAGVTVTFTRNAANTPVAILATGNVTIAGTISVNGTKGGDFSSSGPPIIAGGLGGPGGFNGGQGGSRGTTNNGGAGGQGPGGGNPAPANGSTSPTGGTYGAPTSFVSLLPLFGGSGGGGSFGSSTRAASSGGGGGGAIVIASSTTITVTGSITANGGDGGGITISVPFAGAGGSGGAIRLVAPQISGAGQLRATVNPITFAGGDGRIRLEAFTQGFTGSSIPAASLSTAPGPVTPASSPALTSLPTLTISSVGGVAAPATPGGSYTTSDVALPSGTVNPVLVTLASTNTPVGAGTVFSIKLIPQFASPTTITGASITQSGTFSNATATGNVTFPTGQISVLNAFATFTLPQLASLFPLLDGEPVEQILMAAQYGEASTLSLVTKSGKQVPVSQLSQEDQLKVAMAFEALRN